MERSVTVRVPATSANLGPGFDSIGLALDLTQDVTLGTGQDQDSRDGLIRLVLDGARSAYRLARTEVPELSASSVQTIPPGRGLGASAAARAAGIVGANALLGGLLTDEQMLTLGGNLEGHADNMAPALFGGLRVVVREGEGYRQIAAPLAPGMRVVLLISDLEMPTVESRKLLPQQLSREDAVFNVGRAAMLVAALSSGDWAALDAASQDRLHQPARTNIFPAIPDIIRAAREAGAHCAYLSGAGSTIAAFATERVDEIGAAMHKRAVAGGYRARTIVASPSKEGATVIAGP